jgi:hypothetical protein
LMTSQQTSASLSQTGAVAEGGGGSGGGGGEAPSPPGTAAFANAAEATADAVKTAEAAIKIASGQDIKLTPAQIAEAKQKAQEMSEGQKEIMKMLIVMGTAGAREALLLLGEMSPASDAAKGQYRDKINAIEGVHTDGGYSVPYAKDGKERNMRLTMARCPKAHDLKAQFDKLDPYLNEKQRKIVRSQLSYLLYGVRSRYAQLFKQHEKTIAPILKAMPESDRAVAKLGYLDTDTASSNCYIVKDWPFRIGFVFVDG